MPDFSALAIARPLSKRLSLARFNRIMLNHSEMAYFIQAFLSSHIHQSGECDCFNCIEARALIAEFNEIVRA